MQKTVLVTGATGFLGRWVVEELLSAGWAVRVLARRADHPTLTPWRGRVEVFTGDVLDLPSLQDSLDGAASAVHAAAVVSFARSKKREMNRANVEGTANVVNAALETEGFQRLVFVSSVAALGRSGNGETIDESQKWQDSPLNSDYGNSKRMAEREVFRGVAEGLSAQIANPCLILGPGDWNQGPPRMFRTVDRGLKHYPVGANSLVGVWDVARALRLLLEVEDPTCRRHVIAAETLTYFDLFSRIARALGRPAPSRRVPYWLAALAGRTMEALPSVFGEEPPLTRQSARTTASRFDYSSAFFRERFSFNFASIDEVIARTAEAYRKDHAHQA